MKQNALLIALGAAILIFIARKVSAAQESDYVGSDPENDVQPATNDPSYWFLQDQSSVESVNMGSPENNLLAFLALIRKFESDDRYNVLYGGKTFNDYSKHPNIRVPINIPGYEGQYSTAAGAYQQLYKTWIEQKEKLQLEDFSPASQDSAAIGILSDIGAMPAIQSGNFDEALRIASSRWASLPYSPAKQNPRSIAAANEFLTRYLETLA